MTCTFPHTQASSNDTGIVKRLQSFTSSISQLTSSSTTTPSSMPSPSFQSHMQPATIPPSPIPSPLEFSEDNYVKFQVTYVGSATSDSPLTQHCIEDSLTLFAAKGMAAGQAAIIKNTISLQVSSLGVNLTDKSRKLFVHRNYPRKTIAGYCRDPVDSKLFAVISDRPGFANIRKVHVFRCGTEPVEQILDAIKYWLQMEPIKS